MGAGRPASGRAQETRAEVSGQSSATGGRWPGRSGRGDERLCCQSPAGPPPSGQRHSVGGGGPSRGCQSHGAGKASAGDAPGKQGTWAEVPIPPSARLLISRAFPLAIRGTGKRGSCRDGPAGYRGASSNHMLSSVAVAVAAGRKLGRAGQAEAALSPRKEDTRGFLHPTPVLEGTSLFCPSRRPVATPPLSAQAERAWERAEGLTVPPEGGPVHPPRPRAGPPHLHFWGPTRPCGNTTTGSGGLPSTAPCARKSPAG